MQLRHNPVLGYNLCWLGLVPIVLCTEKARDVFAQEILRLAISYGVELTPLQDFFLDAAPGFSWTLREFPSAGSCAEWKRKRGDGLWSFFFFWKVLRKQESSQDVRDKSCSEFSSYAERNSDLRLLTSPADRKLSVRLSDFAFTLRSVLRRQIELRSNRTAQSGEAQELVLAVYSDPGASVYLHSLPTDRYNGHGDRHRTVYTKLPIVLDCSLSNCGRLCHCGTEFDLFRQKLFAVAREHGIEVVQVNSPGLASEHRID